MAKLHKTDKLYCLINLPDSFIDCNQIFCFVPFTVVDTAANAPPSWPPHLHG